MVDGGVPHLSDVTPRPQARHSSHFVEKVFVPVAPGGDKVPVFLFDVSQRSAGRRRPETVLQPGGSSSASEGNKDRNTQKKIK